MITLGYGLMSEEHTPREVVALAQRAEESGFPFAALSDHYHPWVSQQGHAGFAWSILGGIAQQTERLVLGTGVTCPMIRTHPAIIAQAAATTATMMPGRFFLGVGSGENLNEHVLGDPWPPVAVRQEMLDESIQVIRTLWEGGQKSHRGAHYTVEHARIYSLPDTLPPILVAAGGPKSASLAAERGDGLIGTSPDTDLLDAFHGNGGRGARMGLMHLCWAEDEREARETAHHQWPNAALRGTLNRDLRTPQDVESATALAREEDVAAAVPCGPDPEPVLEQIRAFDRAGYDYLYLHQVGRDQEGFFRFFERELLPNLETDQERTDGLGQIISEG